MRNLGFQGSGPRATIAIVALVSAMLAWVFPTSAGAVNAAQSAVVSADPADWTPHVIDGQVNAIVQIGTKAVVGGTFTQVQRANTQAILTRNYLFAFDMITGVIDRRVAGGSLTPRLPRIPA